MSGPLQNSFAAAAQNHFRYNDGDAEVSMKSTNPPHLRKCQKSLSLIRRLRTLFHP
jgi:hypothetical protein